MPHFNSYERNPGQFTNGFDETYAVQIEQAAPNGEHIEDRITLLSDALAWILQYCWDTRGGVTHPRTAMHRFVAVSMTVRPDLADTTFITMARKLRISKASMTAYSTDFMKKVGLQFRAKRRESVRQTLSEVQKRIWAERKNGSHQISVSQRAGHRRT